MLVNSVPNVLVGCMDALKKGGAARWSRRMTWSIFVLSTILVSSYAHVKAGFTLPSPWNDEPWYLWSTISLMENNTFFSESLNPERVVPMSPVYQVPMAFLFKLTGFSYVGARWVSWGYMMLAYLGVLEMVRRRPMPFLSAAVSSLFFLGASAVVAGNMCRPEAMVWAIAVWSFSLLDRGCGWKALSLAGIGVMVHQIGAVFFAGVIFLFLWRVWETKGIQRPSRWDWIIIGLALLVLSGQLMFVWTNWESVRADNAAAMGESFQSTFASRVFLSNKTPWLGVYVVLVVLSLWKMSTLRVPLLMGSCAYMAILVRPQMWYEVYNQMAFMWLTLGIPWMMYWVVDMVLKRGQYNKLARVRSGILLFIFGAGVLAMLKVCYGHGFVTGPNNYPAKLGWGWGMRMDPAPYITEPDINRVIQEIEKHVNNGQHHRVFFMPEGDGLFFYGRLPSNAIPYQGVRTSVRGDLGVFRLSRHPPQWWTDQYVKKFLKMYHGEWIAPFYERDGTEKWILIPPQGMSGERKADQE